MTIIRGTFLHLYGPICLAVLSVVLTACSSGSAPLTFEQLPPSDKIRGAALFSKSLNGAPPCSTCHSERSSASGPTLVAYGVEQRERRREDIYQYTLDAIIRPAKDIAQGYANTMYAGYGDKLSTQEIADLIAYMLD